MSFSMKDFVHLHVHTNYSLLDGAMDIKALLDRVRELGMPAVAITDHGVMYGCLKFYRYARELGINPLLGCEIYVAPRGLKDKVAKIDDNPAHLVLLAENNEGYQNLMQLVSLANLEGFYYRPRVDRAALQRHAKGLIALSACSSGSIARLLLEGQRVEAKAQVLLYQKIFGPTNFFLELQNQLLPEQKGLNEELARLGAECQVPLVATNDVHYLQREDAVMHDLLLCIQTGKTVTDSERLRFPNNEFYLKTPVEMGELFAVYPEALANTVKIAGRCRVELELEKLHLPSFQKGGMAKPHLYLEELCRAAIKERQLAWDSQREERLLYELKIITKMGFVGYFLIVRDFVHFAKKAGIMVGPGRGSAAGSLVAYLLGITNIDPVEHGLLFERFLNPERVSLPDIDIDFCYERRWEVIDYVRQRYGSNRVAQIITFGTMAARAAVRDVGRALGFSYGEVDRLARLIPRELGITLAKARQDNPGLAKLLTEKPHLEELWAIAAKLEGFPRHASTHAAGIVIVEEPLTNYLPLAHSPEKETITQYSMEDIEALGLLKMDFLGLRTLTIIKDTLVAIWQNQGTQINLEEISLADPLAFDLLQKGHTLGVFQLESRGIRRLLVGLKPEALNDVIALLALYRPGPLGSGMVEDYIRARHGQKEISYVHSLLEPILKETYGVILYQEQVMQIASRIGGFSLGEGDLIRRAMGKKKRDVLAAMRSRFLQGAAQRQVSHGVATTIFDLMEYFSGYGFNKSHSAAYGLIAYQTAYLKARYPVEFLAALLTSVINNSDKINLYIEEARRLGIRILPPDVNQSKGIFTPEAEGIRFGLLGIKNLGVGAIEKIIAEGSSKAYTSLMDFCGRVAGHLVTRRVIESLIRGGAFDFTRVARSQMLEGLEEIIEQTIRQSDTQQLSLLENLGGEEFQFSQIPEFAPQTLLEQEKEYLGVYISGHPLDKWRNRFAQNGISSVAELEEEPDGKEVLLGGVITDWRVLQTKAGTRMATFSLEDWSGVIAGVLFPKQFAAVADGYEPSRVAVVKGRLEHQDEGFKVLASQLRWL